MIVKILVGERELDECILKVKPTEHARVLFQTYESDRFADICLRPKKKFVSSDRDSKITESHSPQDTPHLRKYKDVYVLEQSRIF